MQHRKHLCRSWCNDLEHLKEIDLRVFEMKISTVFQKMGCFSSGHENETPPVGRSDLWRRFRHKISRSLKLPTQRQSVYGAVRKCTLQTDVSVTPPGEHGALNQQRDRVFRSREAKDAVACVAASAAVTSAVHSAAEEDPVSSTGASVKCATVGLTKRKESGAKTSAQGANMAVDRSERSPMKTNEVLHHQATGGHGDDKNRNGHSIGVRLPMLALEDDTRVGFRTCPGCGSEIICTTSSQVLPHVVRLHQNRCKREYEDGHAPNHEDAALESEVVQPSPARIADLKSGLLFATSANHRSGSFGSEASTLFSRTDGEDSFMEWITKDRGTKWSKLGWVLESAGERLRTLLCVLEDAIRNLVLKMDWSLPGFLIFGPLFPRCLHFTRRLLSDAIQMMGCF